MHKFASEKIGVASLIILKQRVIFTLSYVLECRVTVPRHKLHRHTLHECRWRTKTCPHCLYTMPFFAWHSHLYVDSSSSVSASSVASSSSQTSLTSYSSSSSLLSSSSRAQMSTSTSTIRCLSQQRCPIRGCTHLYVGDELKSHILNCSICRLSMDPARTTKNLYALCMYRIPNAQDNVQDLAHKHWHTLASSQITTIFKELELAGSRTSSSFSLKHSLYPLTRLYLLFYEWTIECSTWLNNEHNHTCIQAKLNEKNVCYVFIICAKITSCRRFHYFQPHTAPQTLLYLHENR